VSFAGFPSRTQATAIPNAFFSDVMPLLQGDHEALVVALYAFNVLLKKRGFPRYVTAADLAAEPAMATYFGDDTVAAAESGLERLCGFGVLRSLSADGATVLYFLNAPADRRGMDTMRAHGATEVPPDLRRAAPRQAGVYQLYEQLVGTVSPLIADELAEAEQLYPREWMERAFREAAAQNARSWRYVSRILERWATEGPDHAKVDGDAAADDRYFRGRYGRILRQRLDS
jgi:DnaD/phage-associated family protein